MMMKTQLLLYLMMLLPMVVSAHDIEVQNGDGVTIYYNYTNDGYELEVTFRGASFYEYSGEYTGNVVIPEKVTYMNRTRKVTSIGERVFLGCSSLTSVTIPNSMTSIGNEAFQNCSGLISATIGNSVTSIGERAFYGCSGLTSVTIPNSMTNIGYEVFAGCSGLTSVVIPNSVTSIGWHAFYGCSGLTSVTIPNNVTSIGDEAFRECSGLTSVTIPNSVTSIGGGAFWGCSGLTSVTIGNSVTRINGWAFDRCDIPTVISLIENPFSILGKTSEYRVFTLNTFNNATLYVPKGTIDKYKATDGWKDFLFTEESTINGLTLIAARPMQIKTDNGYITVEGVDDQTDVRVYTIEGKQVGAAVSHHNTATIATSIGAGSIAIVKVGDKSMKVLVK